MAVPPRRPPIPWRHRLASLILLSLLALLLSGCTRFPLWPIDPTSPYASKLDRMWMIVSYVAIGVIILVGGLMIYAILRFGQRGPIGDDEPPQFHGNTRLEYTWTLIPTLIVTILLVVAISTLQANEPPPSNAPVIRNAITVNIRGYQWAWAYTFPQLPGLSIPAGDLHLPVNRTIEWRVTSSDVVHDWWVPALAGHLDAYPGHIVRVVIVPTEIGRQYYAQCSKFCGLQHAQMHNNVVVESVAQFARWALANGARRPDLVRLLNISPTTLAALPVQATPRHRT